MLVDMKPVIQCMVVSSAFATARLPIKPNAPEQSQVVDELQRLSMSGDWGRVRFVHPK
jgi:hypothetical protein